MTEPTVPGPTIVFLDTETTSLRPDRRVWEIGAIVRRETHSADVEHRWFVAADDLDLGNADPFSLAIGGYYARHPDPAPNWRRTHAVGVCSEWQALIEVEAITRGAHLVGAVPNFDAEVLDRRMRKNHMAPSWHYHLIDVEPLALGYLKGQQDAGMTLRDEALTLRLPWKSEQLSRALGVPPPAEQDRHTALGDARWVRAIYDTVMGKPA